MSNFKIAKVIIKTPMWQDFDYLIPSSAQFEKISQGQRVVVPFGKRQVVGIVAHLLHSTQIAADKLKFITDLLDEFPILDAATVKLCEWVSQYYHYPLGEVLFGVLPQKLRQLRSVACPNITQESSGGTTKTNYLELSSQQQEAVSYITAVQGFQVILLHGVTGSGKTEVYLQAIARCLERGQQALVLVPEISLTPQTLQRFRDRFDVPIVALHSGLKESERLKNWFAAQTGQARIVIGTRLAVFVPLAQLGIIIIDEEHDGSFKQQSQLRYSARDVAVIRASFDKVVVVLGSATPSLESLYNAWQNRYHYITLPQRAGSAEPPTIKIIDIKCERLVSGMSSYLLSSIERHLKNNGQILIFLNRRGYAPVLLCHQCGYSEACPYCDVHLTFHQEQDSLRCHHCEYVKYHPKICTQCHRADLLPIGIGTEQLEQELQTLYKGYNILRIDRDTTRKKGSLENLLEEAHSHSAHILVGTQMLAKGHHFKNLTLVAVVDADNGLYSTDFRALERLAQLLVQVAGRAGREDHRGEVIIQTHHPDHPMLQCLLQNGFTAFAKELIAERVAAQLPPYAYMALLRAENRQESVARNFLLELKQRISPQDRGKIEILGPIDAPMMRRAGKFRAQLLVQSHNRQVLQRYLSLLMQDDWVKKQKQKVQWSLDVDPIELV